MDNNIKSIFILEMIYADDDETIYPLSLQRYIWGYFSNCENSLQFLKADNTDCWFAKKMPFKIFEIKEVVLDKINSEIQTYMYLQDLTYYGNYISDSKKGYQGRKDEDCLFKIGDIVEFIHGNQLDIGIVSDLPPSKERVAKITKEAKEKFGIANEMLDSSDDCYCICYGSDLSSHAHSIVQHVFKPSFAIDFEYELMMRNNLMQKMNG